MTDPHRSSGGIAFVIPAFNCGETLEEAVSSICDGNLQDEDEIVIVDDCSTDSTPDLIAKLEKSIPRLRSFRHPINKGTAAAARNTAISYVQKDLIFCLDSDNVLAPRSVPGLKAHMIGCGADAAAFGESRFFDQTIDRVTHKMVYGREGWVTLADALAGGIWPGPSGNYLFTRESWHRAGRYFEPVLLNQVLDSWSFGIAQLATGSRMAVMDGSFYYHRFGHSSHFVRNKDKGNVSLAALAGLLPFIHLIADEDVDYMTSREFRYSWFENISNRPIRVKDQGIGQNGSITQQSLRTRAERRLRRLLRGVLGG